MIIQLYNLKIQMGYILFKIIVMLLIALSLNARELMDIYRTEGIKSVEQELEKNLRDLNFWKRYLENKNVDYGYYEFNKYVIYPLCFSYKTLVRK